MSVLDTTNIIIGNSPTQSQNFKFTANNDGTLTVSRADGSQTIMTVDGAGKITFPLPPIHTQYSMIKLNTANGYGSSSTSIPRFTNVVTNVGSDITYADSATLGTTLTINTSGIYGISYSASFSASGDLAISLNSAQLTTLAGSISTTDRLCISTTPAANSAGNCCVEVYLAAGSVIRPHSGATTGIADRASFTITRVS